MVFIENHHNHHRAQKWRWSDKAASSSLSSSSWCSLRMVIIIIGDGAQKKRRSGKPLLQALDHDVGGEYPRFPIYWRQLMVNMMKVKMTMLIMHIWQACNWIRLLSIEFSVEGEVAIFANIFSQHCNNCKYIFPTLQYLQIPSDGTLNASYYILCGNPSTQPKPLQGCTLNLI